MRFASYNPSTGELLEQFADTPTEAIGHMVAQAHAAFLDWRRVPIAERALVVERLAALLRTEAPALARTMALEMGKPLAQGEAEIHKCALVCDHYATHAAAYLAPEPHPSDAQDSHVRFDPLGVVLAVMPWNFPFWQVFRFLAPALMAGNAAVLKHAPSVPRCALALQRLVCDAGFPHGLLGLLFVAPEALDPLYADPRIQAVTLTGSDRAGRAVAERAGRALKKVILELGGSDPFIVLADADIEAAARVAAQARLLNSGQSCIAAKRFIAVAPIYDRFLAAFVAEMARHRMGDPLDPTSDLGPQARHDLRDALHTQVLGSIAAGAQIALGATLPEGPGAFYPPTVLTEVHPGMPAFDQETFGPVAAVTRAADETEAIALANQTAYGLGASLWTQDRRRGAALAADIEAGAVFINGLVRSDPRLPFGGIKQSGYGRELSEYGIRELCNIKTVWIG